MKVVLKPVWLACLALSALGAAQAQQVQTLSLENIPPDLVQAEDAGAGADPGMLAIDLGEDLDGASMAGSGAPALVPGMTSSSSGVGVATRAAQQARSGKTRLRAAPGRANRAIEHAVFERQPVRVPLPVEQERLITLPAPAALHVPSDMDRVARLEVIDRTVYATALVPFTPIRIVAELIDSGQQIPLDLLADESTASATSELQLSVVEPEHLAAARGVADDSSDEAEPSASPDVGAIDMVELTRHAARQLYAPRRLAWATPGVQQVEVSTAPFEGLIPGLNVETAALGQWRGGQLYVTAVRVTNRSRHPLELPIDELRGQWLAVTAQHGRIGAAGSETDTTALYLVCERAFEACR